MKKSLAAMVAGVRLTAASCAFGADAQWVNNLGNGYYSDGGNWDTFIPPSGADSAAAFYYDPTYNDVGANILNDMDWTIGYMLFEDLAGFGSSSIGLTIPTGGATATVTIDSDGAP